MAKKMCVAGEINHRLAQFKKEFLDGKSKEQLYHHIHCGQTAWRNNILYGEGEIKVIERCDGQVVTGFKPVGAYDYTPEAILEDEEEFKILLMMVHHRLIMNEMATERYNELSK